METPKENSEFKHYVLARTHHNKMKNRTTRGGLEYSSEMDANRGASSSKYQLPLYDITRQTHNDPGWTNG